MHKDIRLFSNLSKELSDLFKNNSVFPLENSVFRCDSTLTSVAFAKVKFIFIVINGLLTRGKSMRLPWPKPNINIPRISEAYAQQCGQLFSSRVLRKTTRLQALWGLSLPGRVFNCFIKHLNCVRTVKNGCDECYWVCWRHNTPPVKDQVFVSHMSEPS